LDNLYRVDAYQRSVVDLRLSDGKAITETIIFDVKQSAQLYATIVFNASLSDCHSRIVVNAESSAVVSLIIIGAQAEKNVWDIVINCNGQDTHVSVSIGYVLNNHQSLQLTTQQTHNAIGCVSSIVSKGVLFDMTKVDFSGLITIDESGRYAQATLHNKNILASDAAIVRARPQLEITAHEVSCTHGAASGSLDEQDLYYVQSRGLDQRSARALLIQGFIKDIIEAHQFYDQGCIWQELKNKLTL
jgi:Fe-S cluster assembly protein SufD